MESLFIQLEISIEKTKKIDTYDWFCGPWSHIWRALSRSLQRAGFTLLVPAWFGALLDIPLYEYARVPLMLTGKAKSAQIIHWQEISMQYTCSCLQ